MTDTAKIEEGRALMEKATRKPNEVRHNFHNWMFDNADWLLTAAAERDAAIARVREIEADKNRLDFLDHLNARLNARSGTTCSWKLITNHNVNRLMLGQMAVDLNDMAANGLPSCRDAIDARMRALSPKPQEAS